MIRPPARFDPANDETRLVKVLGWALGLTSVLIGVAMIAWYGIAALIG